MMESGINVSLYQGPEAVFGTAFIIYSSAGYSNSLFIA